MKIGIMTFWQAKENYGQILQLYALYSFLKELGHEPFLIRYDRISGDRPSVIKDMVYKFRLMLSHPRALIGIFRSKLNNQKFLHTRQFQQFINKYIDSTDCVYKSLIDLQHEPPLADVYICGSDQIWNQDEHSYSPAFFLDFGSNDVIRIAYAASFGKERISNNMARKILPLLKRFNIITVREDEGVDICKRMGLNAYRVPDPTMIVDIDIYHKLLSFEGVSYESNNPYIMMYLLGHETDVPFKDIYAWASSRSMPIRYVASDQRFDKYNKEYPTIPRWIAMVKYSKYMITNSFHGTVFAILFNIPFVTLPLVGRMSAMNGRVFSLLKDYGLEDRILTSNRKLRDIIDKPIDFELVNIRLLQNKNMVLTILSALNANTRI